MRKLNSLTIMLDHYGYIVLFIALILELLAFPLPGEVLMTYCGVLVSGNRLNWVFSIFIATFGAIIGVTLSYLIGKILGIRFFVKYGHYIHLGEERLNKVSEWFNKYGNRLLLITYFIPGVRHVTGYFSGITKTSYKEFTVNAYLGAFIWTTTFISIGKLLGPKWDRYHNLITRYLLIGSLVLVLILIGIYLYKNHKTEIKQKTIYLLSTGFKIFHSFGTIKIFMLGIVISFLAFFALVIGLIQDFLAHEFSQFDEVTKYIVGQIFNKNWYLLMNQIRNVADIKVLIGITVISGAVIIFKGIDKLHEIKYLIITTIGAELFSFILRSVFHRIGPMRDIIGSYNKYSFPSQESLMLIVVFGFLVYVIARHNKKIFLNSIIISISIIICLLVGISVIYLGIEYPSDVIAGYELGGLWLTSNIILLEINRILPTIDLNK